MLVTVICLLVLLLIIFSGVCFNNTSDNATDFLNLNYSTALKGIACIIIIFVHIPNEYGNIVQNLVGSFAYIGVTIFFMFSAYGCQYGVENKSNYLSEFWRNRIMALFLPAITINSFIVVFGVYKFGTQELFRICKFNSYIYALLVYYLIFYLVWRKNTISDNIKDVIICFSVIIGSLITKFTEIHIFQSWPVEVLGVVWGIIIYKHKEKIEQVAKRYYIRLLALFGGLSAILGVLYIKYKMVSFWGDYLLRAVLGISILVFILVLTVNLSINGRRLKSLGNISYEIYLSHIAIIVYMNKLFEGKTISSNVYIGLLLFFTLLLATIAKTVVYLIMKIIKKEVKENG